MYRCDSLAFKEKSHVKLYGPKPTRFQAKATRGWLCGVVFFFFGVCAFCLTKHWSGESLSAKGMLCFFFASAQLKELTCFPVSLKERDYFCALEIVTIVHSCFHWGWLPPRCNDSSSHTKNPRTGCNQPQIWRETLRNCLWVPRKTAAVYNMLFLMSTQLNPHVKLDVSKRK